MKHPNLFITNSLLVMLALSGCSSTSLAKFSATTGQTISTGVGSPMVEWSEGTRSWLGSYGTHHQLIYSGMDGSTMLVSYRENAIMDLGMYARQPFYQELRYDLSKSREIAFQDVRLNILETDNTHVRFQVLQAPAAKE